MDGEVCLLVRIVPTGLPASAPEVSLSKKWMLTSSRLQERDDKREEMWDVWVNRARRRNTDERTRLARFPQGTLVRGGIPQDAHCGIVRVALSSFRECL